MMVRPNSVVNGRDPECLTTLLAVHAPESPEILDFTYGQGVMWKGTGRVPFRMDLNPDLDVDEVGDFMNMPFEANRFDVMVFDPPHFPNAGGTLLSLSGSAAPYRAAYGLTDDGHEARRGDDITPLFLPFLIEARRVLRPGGLVFAKIKDFVHNHRYQWQHIAFIDAARQAGMTPCDLIVKADPAGGNLKSGKWQQAVHLRNSHCFWIVVRNGRSCEPPRSNAGREPLANPA